MKYQKYLLVLIIALIPLLGYTQLREDKLIHITKDNYEDVNIEGAVWKFRAGDSLQWAAKNWDDAAWVKASPLINSEEQSNKMGFKGTGWFRLSFHADSTMAGRPVLLYFKPNGAAEIYLDGILIRRVGTLKNSEASEYEKPFSPAIFVLKDTGVHTFAIRYENIYYQSMLQSWNGNNAGFSIRFTEYYSFFGSQKDNILFFSLFLLISGGVFFALFLSHLVMYFFHKNYQANLIFSLFNLGLGLFFIVSYVSQFIESQDTQLYILPVFILAPAMSFLTLNLLVNRLFFWSRVRVIISIVFFTLVAIVTFLDYHIAISILMLYLAYTIVEAAVMVIVAVRRKIPGSSILSFGILCTFLLFAFLVICGMAGRLNFVGYAGLVFLVTCMLAIFSLPLSMSAYLAWSFASVNKNLFLQLKQVELLSEKTLAQEQEKQAILEGQKETLEREVSQRTKEVMRQKDELESEKKKSDELLLNILPHEIAEELKATGQSKAHQYDEVSVLFTDFVNFTQISEKLGVDQLLEELNINFTAFDRIMEKYGLEKIKTIGDAYLAVSGLPAANQAHAQNAVLAALDIIQFVAERRTQVDYGLDIRIGINSGSLIAGIIGVKKFAYDIWGDTVNIAARMEQSSAPGKVNISESTYQLIKNDFDCLHRGKVDAKHKGEMDMYFVTQVNSKNG